MNVNGSVVRTAQDLGAVIRGRRHAAGRGQAEVAQSVGVSRTWLSLVENARSPGAEFGLVLAVLDELGIDLVAQGPGEDDGTAAGRAPGSQHEGVVDLDAIIDAHRGAW